MSSSILVTVLPLSLTPAQCRMARAALQIGVREIAKLAEVSPNTIARFERGESLYPRTTAAIRAAFEEAGVEFIAENGGGAGVRMRMPSSPADATASPAFAETIATSLDALPVKAVEDPKKPS